jgi:hypothetical protein
MGNSEVRRSTRYVFRCYCEADCYHSLSRYGLRLSFFEHILLHSQAGTVKARGCKLASQLMKILEFFSYENRE